MRRPIPPASADRHCPTLTLQHPTLHSQHANHCHHRHAASSRPHTAQHSRCHQPRKDTRHSPKDIPAQLQLVLRATVVHISPRHHPTHSHTLPPNRPSRHRPALPHTHLHLRHRTMRRPLGTNPTQLTSRHRRSRTHIQPLSHQRVHRQAPLPLHPHPATVAAHTVSLHIQLQRFRRVINRPRLRWQCHHLPARLHHSKVPTLLHAATDHTCRHRPATHPATESHPHLLPHRPPQSLPHSLHPISIQQDCQTGYNAQIIIMHLRSAKAERSLKIIELLHHITLYDRSALAERRIKSICTDKFNH